MIIMVVALLLYESKSDHIVQMAPSGINQANVVSNDIEFRPAISLGSNISFSANSDVTIYGQPGTQTNPYVVE